MRCEVRLGTDAARRFRTAPHRFAIYFRISQRVVPLRAMARESDVTAFAFFAAANGHSRSPSRICLTLEYATDTVNLRRDKLIERPSSGRGKRRGGTLFSTTESGAVPSEPSCAAHAGLKLAFAMKCLGRQRLRRAISPADAPQED
jgi:hypothetical protein